MLTSCEIPTTTRTTPSTAATPEIQYGNVQGRRASRCAASTDAWCWPRTHSVAAAT